MGGALTANLRLRYDGALTAYLWLRYDGALTANLRLRYDGALTAYLWLRYDGALTANLWLRYDGALTANLRLGYDGALTAYLWLRYDGAVVRAGSQLGVLPGGEDHGAQVVVGVLCCAVIGCDGGCRLVQRHEHCIHGDDLVPGHKHAGCHWAEGVTDQLQLDGASAIDQDIKPGGGTQNCSQINNVLKCASPILQSKQSY